MNRTLRLLLRLPAFLKRRVAYYGGVGFRYANVLLGRYKNRITIHTVFVAKENILFLKEWILYHKLKGVDYFYLYDNSGAQRGLKWDWQKRYFQPGRVNRHGINYADLITLSDAEIRAIMDDIQETIPGVHFIKWQPKDKDGTIFHGQVEGHQHMADAYGDTCDWVFVMDMDEFLVSERSLKSVTRELHLKGLVGAHIAEKRMTSRFSDFDRYCVEIDKQLDYKAYSELGEALFKYVCNPRKVNSFSIHSFIASGKQIALPREILFRYHYCADPVVSKNEVTTVKPAIDPKLLAELKRRSGDYCSPEWRRKSVALKPGENVYGSRFHSYNAHNPES